MGTFPSLSYLSHLECFKKYRLTQSDIAKPLAEITKNMSTHELKLLLSALKEIIKKDK